ncbi:MAG: hypothetical protein GXP42_14400 [Chloroflexi bacterium]|nr:hypothetical protein [Chloroflexota bacterium]
MKIFRYPMPTPTPPSAPIAPAGLPLEVWANLPLIVCLIFAFVTLTGVIVLILLNRRDARLRAEEEMED